jgi:hypothetical protein
MLHTGGVDWMTFCDMSADGGGWALVLKADGDSPTFGYDSPLWTDTNTLAPGSADLSLTEAKLAGFHTMPFTLVRVMLEARGGAFRSVIVPHTGTSLRDVFAGDTVFTSVGAGAWSSLMVSPSLQLDHSCEGFNITSQTWNHWVRIGIAGNNERDCGTTDSRIGIGGRQDTSMSRCGGPPCPGQENNTVGNAAMCVAGDCVDQRTWGFLFVR